MAGHVRRPALTDIFLKLYALDTVLNISSSTTKIQLEQAMKGHMLEAGANRGLYKR